MTGAPHSHGEPNEFNSNYIKILALKNELLIWVKLGLRSSIGPFQYELENGDDEYDDYLQQPEKKRHLKSDQVQFLEKSFETDNKLEPDRKIQLAKDLGLQPRQIAIWFQNRRARWKTKQLEKDYDVLQESFNELKSKYENLLQEKEKLKSELQFSSNDSAEAFGGITESKIRRRRAHVFRFWVENNSSFGGRDIEAGLRWKSVTMNQSEIDDLSRDA
ncbi:hypothetical protein LXL04_036867 [Taraxacum kok-saghyz]